MPRRIDGFGNYFTVELPYVSSFLFAIEGFVILAQLFHLIPKG